jgi:hypothetical protein
MDDMPTALIAKRVAADAESERILDELELAVGIHGTRVDGTWSYDLGSSRDWLVAVTSIRAQLDQIAPDWQDRLDLAVAV